tara:strand:- start:1231 stop:1632 length:402 start_codon:yes stop_codon:yes gene_type:complete
MSIIKKIKTFSSDDRGDIIDIFSNEPKEHCTIVTFNKNAVRGNHFHKKSIQSAYVLNGKFKVLNVKVDDKSNYSLKDVEETEVSEGHYIIHNEYEAHAYKCESDFGKLLVFTTGIRGGEKYEEDTYRLQNKLI